METPICQVDEVSESGKEVFIDGPGGGTWLLLMTIAGRIHGWHNHCPHQGRALNWADDRFLFDDEGHLVCPHHGACFELPSGHCVAGPCQGEALRPVNLRVEDGAVYYQPEETA